MIGIYVRNDNVWYADAIVHGIKTVETRNRDVFGKFIGQRVAVIATRPGYKAEIVGSVMITDKKQYTAAELDLIRDKTMIPTGDKYDITGGTKWGYKLEQPFAFNKPVPLSIAEITKRNRSFVEFEL